MTWSIVGWVLIAAAAILLLALTFWVRPDYDLRHFPFVKNLRRARTTSLEQGRRQQVVLGEGLWSRAYGGLGLSALSGAATQMDSQTLADGRMSLATASGSLAVLARQLVQGAYQDGFSEGLLTPQVRIALYGPTPFSFNAGLMSELKMKPYGTLLLLGNFGPKAAIAVDNIQHQRGDAFAAAGTLTAQAALYLNVRDILLGEEVYAAETLLAPNPMNRAVALAEDLLRLALITALVIGAILKALAVI
ncbi:hypothetical protein KQH50_03325 [bacterium]|nr:hypothetical protein [bacterium]